VGADDDVATELVAEHRGDVFDQGDHVVGDTQVRGCLVVQVSRSSSRSGTSVGSGVNEYGPDARNAAT
jgi:hypothetical protein